MITCPRCSHQFEPPAPMRPLPLTRVQWAIRQYLVDFMREHGFAPSFAEIAEHFGYSSLATVHEQLETLEKKGWIRRYRGARAIELVEEPA